MLLFALLLLFDDPAKLFERGMNAWTANDLITARASFADAAKQAPSNASVWMMLAQTCVKQGDVKAAQAAAGNAEKFGSKDPAILQGLANFYANTDIAHAAAIGARYAQLVPQDVSAWQRVAEMYLAGGKLDQAIDAALKSPSKTAELHALLGKAYAQRKSWAQSDEEFKQAIRISPYDEQLRLGAAQSHLMRLDFIGAEQVLIEARKVFDKSPQLELTLGVAYYGERKFANAVDQFLLTMKLSPDLPQPYAFLGRILEHAGDRLPEVTERFASFEQRNPGNPLAYLVHAKAIMPERPDEALELLKKSVALNESDGDTHLQLGILLTRNSQWNQAREHLERSIQLNGKDSAAHFQLAKVYSALGRKEDAARERQLHEKLSEAEKSTR